jgi:uncharacterized membrane protein YfbV (UPF0208 family)
MSEQGVGMLAERATIKQRLIREQAELQKRLEQVNGALDAMEEQPKVAELIERIIRVI